MFDRVLVANRGEVALRVLRACKALGLKTIAVYSTADAGAAYLEYADESVCIGPASASLSYRNARAVLLAAHATEAHAIHPGYGFLSEDPAFAQSVADAGLIFIGPSPVAIRTMGDKVAAKRAMRAAGLPCVPGHDDALPDDLHQASQIVEGIGYPVMLKASGGGGGRGMRVVRHRGELRTALEVTREEARHAFGQPSVYAERFLESPRHIEIQVLRDCHGHALWLGSRDCSVQRRHQKVLEEAPALRVPRELLSDLGERCVQACHAIDYHGAGTFEFLHQDGRFHFIEMNTRLQVEHTLTEMVTGIDIVEQQIRIARGEALAFTQRDVIESGHAIECRINAEDPETCLPSPGRVTHWVTPGGPGVRVDSHMQAGQTVSPHYDSLMAKLVTHGSTRQQALARMRVALAEMQVVGLQTNIPLHRRLMDDPALLSGPVDNRHLERLLNAGHAR